MHNDPSGAYAIPPRVPVSRVKKMTSLYLPIGWMKALRTYALQTDTTATDIIQRALEVWAEEHGVELPSMEEITAMVAASDETQAGAA